MKKKNLAFTLAEVLIVIGIIGVVAALTLPNLNHATGDKEKVTKVKKIYSTLSEAFDRATVVYGNADTWFKGLTTQKEKSERFAKRMIEFMKISKDCGNSEGCFSSAEFFTSDGASTDNNLQEYMTDDYMVMTPDGISLGFYTNTQGGAEITVDIDGPNKGKNLIGSDLFYFTVGLDEELIEANDLKYKYLQLIPDVNHDDGNLYETAWVIEFSNLDYLKCRDNLNWETGSCN